MSGYGPNRAQNPSSATEPVGSRARERGDIDKAPAGVSVRANTNQSKLHVELPVSCPLGGATRNVPGGQWSRWETSDMDKAAVALSGPRFEHD
jgi:hypothetical protein